LARNIFQNLRDDCARPNHRRTDVSAIVKIARDFGADAVRRADRDANGNPPLNS
jgi:hypothetical protein